MMLSLIKKFEKSQQCGCIEIHARILLACHLAHSRSYSECEVKTCQFITYDHVSNRVHLPIKQAVS